MAVGCSNSSKLLVESTTEDDFDFIVRAYAPSEDAWVAVQRIAGKYINRRRWKDAIDVYEKYRDRFPNMQGRFDSILAMLKAPMRPIRVKNLGYAVNSRANEFKPSVSGDETKIYFSSDDRPGGKGGNDIWVSTFENNKWQPAKNLGAPINSPEHESINSISADGRYIVLYGGYEGHLGGGDNFYYEKTADGWSSIQHFPYPINTEYFESDGYFTADGQAFFFTSDRPGGIGEYHPKGREPYHGSWAGNLDIYVVVRQGDGWSKPINLGPVINTPYAERSPFLHADGKTLYFSSDGHLGFGRLDVFKSVRLNEDSWTEWSTPVNLGKEINTADDDWGYKVSTSGLVAYFASSAIIGGLGHGDIYRITLPKEVQPEKKVLAISGTVFDEDGNPVPNAVVRWEDLEKSKTIGEVRSDPADGKYFITLAQGRLYGYYAEKPGYYPTSQNVDLRDTSITKRTVDIVITSLAGMLRKELAQRINNIFFDFDKYELRPESYPELDRLVDFIKNNQSFFTENPDVRIEIGAHTDDKGTEEYNLRLSQNRARSVVDYLTRNGIPGDLIITKGYGESKPQVPNDSEEHRALNRRVEFKLVKSS